MDYNSNQLKRQRMYLDLKSPSTTIAGNKRLKFQHQNNNKIELLSSPDVQMLKLGSPELEKFIISNNLPTPSSLVTPTQVFFPKNVTEEQELYAKGFVDALAQLQESDHSVDSESDDDDSNSNQPNTFGQFKQGKDAIVPNCEPVNMESQERIKLERKRQRNRVAASKCRKRKLEKISKLEDKVKALKNENENLNSVLNKLKDTVGGLKGKIMQHVQQGCHIMINNSDELS